MRRLLSALVAAVAAPSIGWAAQAADPGEQLEFDLKSGSYVCEFGQRIDVLRDARSSGNMQIGWKGRRYDLARDLSYSGLPRYEDRRSGLVWIDLPWKGVLLDARTQKPLANECKTV